MESILHVVPALVAIIVGLAGGYIAARILDKSRIQSAKSQAEELKIAAEKEAETIKKQALLEAKDKLFLARSDLENEIKERRSELSARESRLLKKEENLDRKAAQQESKEIILAKHEKDIEAGHKRAKDKEREADILVKKQLDKLEQLAGLSSNDARDILLQKVEDETRIESARIIRQIEEETHSQADKKAKEIVATAIGRYAADYVAERTVSVVNLPNEEMKGRIIGREGRNIRAIEAATGIDLIIDDTPEAVILSGYNSIRREIARLSLERLINDGRIHPARIEEVVKKVTQEMEETIVEAGEQASFDVGVHGINPELIKLLGKLKYRTSFAQNVYQHSIEVAFLCGIMAAELGLNPKKAKRAGLLHDIGKAIDHEVEGAHAIIGADIARRHGESPLIVNAIAAHHGDEEPTSMLAVLVQAADTLSAARPGARREMLENYVKRLEDLERIADSFKGVSKSFAIQAGREIRIIVENSNINDDGLTLLARDIRKKIEKELSYPGQIKIVVIREARAVEYAR
ncbi:MAG TPA: ribonuclease Y [Desulfomonilaceae bacterium]|nr:ribonuclease Y [Desulfomonilaceae bacterium]